MVTRLLVFLLLAAAFLRPCAAAPLSGTKSVGPTGDYASLTAAVADVQAVGNGLGGALILELQATYLSTVETFPLTIPTLNGASAANTLTLRPASGAAALSISSADTTAATVDLKGARFVIIDGRSGGAGTSKQLTIANTSTSGVALRFINEASDNIVRHTTIRGVNTSAASGVVLFGTTTGANGNDNNTIESCDIREGASTPTNGVYSSGSIASAPQNNSGNTLSNSNVFNFYSATAGDAAGVRLDGGNTDWNITGNSFYQTASRAAVAGATIPVFINNTSGNNFTVTGNFIGGSAPNAAGTAWTTTGTTLAYLFQGIRLNVGTTTPSSVQGNSIANIIWTSSANTSALPGVWSGIYVQAGSANVGTVAGNTIGSGTGAGSVTVTSASSINFSTTFGIGSASSGAVAIVNNTVGSITANGSNANVGVSIVGIQVTAGSNTISNNVVGSTSTANSLNATSSTGSNATQQVTGIFCSGVTSASIAGNSVANLNNNYGGAGSGGQIRGIVGLSGAIDITGNTVRNLTTPSRNVGTGTSAAVLGIVLNSLIAGRTLSQNVVHSLSGTAVSEAVSVTGIYYSGATSGMNVIARNFVHSLSIISGSNSSVLGGMEIGAGAFTAQNNMVRVGLNLSGASTAGASTGRGIWDNGMDSGRNFYHNSVHIGGVQTSGARNTFALASTGVSNARDIRNNIFANVRGNSTGSGRHYAVQYGGATANPAGLVADNNIFFGTAAGSVLGQYNGMDHVNLASWQTATGVDAASAFVDPRFVAPGGTAATVDLHLQSSNPAEARGAAIAGVTDDFDGQIRTSFTPADIGADAGNFTYSAPPVITFTPLPNTTSTANRTLTGFATITDDGSVAGGASAPRLYYKKSTNADAFGGNTSATDGWKFVTASNAGSPYDFTIDYTLLTGGGVAAGDAIQYFVVAQDTAGNASSSPAGGAWSASPPVQNINARPATVNTYFILSPVGPTGTRTVGPTGDYPSLAAVIQNLQVYPLSGPLVLELQPSYVSNVEIFPLTFASFGATATNPITIRPQSGATNLSITSADASAATVDLNGAQFVTIDGRPGGVGSNAGSGGGAVSQLTIANTSTAGAALRFINEASGNSVRYTTLRGVNTSATSGVVVFSTTSGPNGNDNNTIDHCDIRDGASTPVNGVYSLGKTTTTVANNSGNTVSNCNIFNFYSTDAADSAGVRLDAGSTEWAVAGNSLYQTTARAGQGANLRGIHVNNAAGNGFTVTDNFIGGTAANAGGSAWPGSVTVISFDRFQAIRLNVGTVTPSSVQGNTIRNMVWKSSSFDSPLPGQWTGIYVVAGSVNIGTVTGNTIGSGMGNDSISIPAVSNGAFAHGIGSTSSGTVAIANNVVGSITMNPSGTNSSPTLIAIQVTAGTNTISGNTVGSTTTANSLNVPAPSTNSSFSEQVTGILSTSVGSAVITNNIVANLNSNYAGTAAASQVRGIVTNAGVNTITGNTVRNLSTTSPVAGLGASSSVLGISQTSSSAGQTVSRNVIHSMSNTAASADVKVTGIYYSGAATGTNVLARNLIHSLAVASNGAPGIRGMDFGGGAFTVQNNMVRLGLDAAGASTGGTAGIYGIVDNNSVNGRNFFNNTILVTGAQTGGSVTTIAFISLGVGNSRSFQNNIFANLRTNGIHYPVRYSGTGTNPTGLTASNNLFFKNSGGFLGFYDGSHQSTLTGWQTVTGQDAASALADPLFVNPNGTAATVDLHVAANSPAISAGFPAGVADDFDGQARNAVAPTTGADEIPAPDIAVSQFAPLTDGVSSVDFGTVTAGGSGAPLTFTITNPGTAGLSDLVVTRNGTNADDFTISALSGTSVPATGGSVTFTVTFAPGTSGVKTAAIHIASNVTGAKNPFDIALSGTAQSVFTAWASANGVANDPGATGSNGLSNLLNFAFGVNPLTGDVGGLVFNGTFGAGGAIGAAGLPITRAEIVANVADIRVLFVRRKDAAAAGLTYTVQFSANLVQWEVSAVVPTILADDGVNQIVSVPFPATVGGEPARFSRLGISIAP